MRRALTLLLLFGLLMTACASVNLDAPIPTYDTGVDPGAWALVPAGEFLEGQFDAETDLDAYEIMVTDVTVAQYVRFLDAALADGTLKLADGEVVGFYPGDEFHGARHEEEINAGDYVIVPTDDPASRFAFDDGSFDVKPGYADHPMTNVSWFGARAYCDYYGWRLPT
ncbi:MAG: SUMF1/EgtB/PvdO family nonheme iron enzyme, partial [Anaerolineae bacterium]